MLSYNVRRVVPFSDNLFSFRFRSVHVDEPGYN